MLKSVGGMQFVANVLFLSVFMDVTTSCRNPGYSKVNITTESVGSFSNPNFTWSENVPNITLRFQLMLKNQLLLSGFNRVTVLIGAKPLLSTLQLTTSTCKAAMPYTRKAKMLLKCSLIDQTNSSSTTIDVNLTLNNPSISFNNHSIKFQFSRVNRSFFAESYTPIYIKYCPQHFENTRLQRPARLQNTNFSYQDEVPVQCTSGIMFHISHSKFGNLAYPPINKVCGPYATWKGPSLDCWQKQTVNLSDPAVSGKTVKLIGTATVFLCYNENLAVYSKVSLRIGQHKEIKDKLVAWCNVSLSTKHNTTIQAFCVQHYRNGTTLAKSSIIHITHFAPRFFHDVLKYVVEVDSPAHIKIPFTAHFPIHGAHVYIKRNGSTYTAFKKSIVPGHHRHHHFIVLRLSKVTANDLGNYTITITEPKYNNNAIATMMLTVQMDQQSESMVALVIVGSSVFALLVITLLCYFFCKRKRLSHSTVNDDESQLQLSLGVINTANDDDVFLSDSNHYEVIGTTSSAKPLTTKMHKEKNVDAVDEDGYLTPLQLGLGQNYVHKKEDEDNGSNATSVTYVNTSYLKDSNYVNLSFHQTKN